MYDCVEVLQLIACFCYAASHQRQKVAQEEKGGRRAIGFPRWQSQRHFYIIQFVSVAKGAEKCVSNDDAWILFEDKRKIEEVLCLL